MIEQTKLLSPTFNPKEIYIVSTDVNRTIMSAYSEITSWYPLGTSKSFQTGGERDKALPPFPISDKEKILSILKDSPTMGGFQPIPIHVSQEIDQLLRAMDPPVCPVVSSFEDRARKEADFLKINEKYKDNILKSLKENWGIKEDLDIFSAKKYTDTYYAAMFDQRPINSTYKLDETKFDAILAEQFYYVTFYYDEMVRIASHKFLNFLYTLFDSKIKSISTGQDDGTGIKERKLVYFSAHDSTVAAIMSGIEQKQLLQPFYAIPIFIELWKKAGTQGKDPKDYYVNFLYNDKSINVNGTCTQSGSTYKCDYSKFKEFLQYRQYQGNWDQACQGIIVKPAYFGKWYIIAGVSAGILTFGAFGYFMLKKLMFTPKEA